MNLAVPAETVTFEGDAPKVYEDTGASGLKVLRKFCANCGSPLVSDVKAFSGLLFIKAGTLDDPGWVRPGAEIWCDSKLGWATLGSELPKMPGNPPAG
ncbi:MAG: GFA family protein [Burkholderiaceae bacterium]